MTAADQRPPHVPAPGRPVPVATYRLQLSRDLTFDDVAGLLDYLAALGVSHAYLSPVLQAVPGSTHGYDVVDHSQLSEDLGGGEAYVRLYERLVETGLGTVVDVVPNHVAVPTPASLNAPLWSVLREGPRSPYAGWFDVDWDLGEGALLVPVLGQRIGECLRDGELSVDRSGGPSGGPVLRYYDHCFPLREGTADLPLAELVDRQWYRLAYWRVADEELNYRRFFDVDTLAGLRVEREEVFAESHALLLAMVREGSLDGLRIDHPDGLADPRGYLRRLAAGTDGSWVVVEKILEGTEPLPDDWPCSGTTGYDALHVVGGVLLDPAGEPVLTTLYQQLTGEPGSFAPVVEEAKREIVEHSLYAEVNRLVEVLHAICQEHVELRDHTRRGLREALVELLVAFPVYRAYVVPGEEPSQRSVEIVTAAAETAKAHLPEDQHATVELLRDLALGRHGRGRHRDELVVRFQQTCGPVMAKGVEDTAFYRWFRLASLNEVGGDPGHLGRGVGEFHAWCARQQQHWPVAMTSLSTHDTKRAEDVRARLGVLTEVPEEWGAAVTSWRATASAYRPDRLDANTEYLLWQTLLGAWPVTEDRLVAYLEKATREAKRHTTWVDQDAGYDAAVREFAGAVLRDEDVRAQVEEFRARIEPAVRSAVLAQKLLQLTVPGVPDVYQGTERVELSLVDPDNRRPVDYAVRRDALRRLDAGEAPRDLDDEKQLVTSRALRLRTTRPALFGAGATYEPLGSTSEHAVAFCRTGGAVTVATRLAARLERAGGWGGATVRLPDGPWEDVLTGRRHDGGDVALGELLAAYPVALLARP